MGTQALSNLAAYVASVRNQFIERAVLIKPFCSSFRAALWDSRYVIGGVADKCKVVNNLLGRDVEFFLHTLDICPA